MIRFGTGGWRAIIADEFTKANIRLVAAGLCRLALEEGYAGQQICVGYDRRFLSKEAAHWAAEVLVGYGFRPFVVARSSPTPLIMFTTKSMNLPYGMAVTASHNPAIYNGIKLFTRGGRDADVAVTQKIEEKIAQAEGEEIPWVDYDEAVAQGWITEGYPVNDYIDSILDAVDVQAIKRSRPRIAVDPMFGVGQSCMRTILLTCRCDVDVIHEQHDTLFGGRMPAPDRESLKQLQHFVVDNQCDLGIATDGDADRLGVIDERGNYVHPNTLLLLLYYYLLKYRGWTGPCVRNNSTTHMLDRVARAMGQSCYEVNVGFKHISAKMTETDAIIGGESSGGMAVRGHISGKDGIYAATLLVEMLAVTGKSLSALYREITQQIGELYYEESACTLSPAQKEALQKKIFEEGGCPAFAEPIDRISREDGCKLYFRGGGWVICRFSGTEPLLRFSAEGDTPEQARGYIAAWRSFLNL